MLARQCETRRQHSPRPAYNWICCCQGQAGQAIESTDICCWRLKDDNYCVLGLFTGRVANTRSRRCLHMPHEKYNLQSFKQVWSFEQQAWYLSCKKKHSLETQHFVCGEHHSQSWSGAATLSSYDDVETLVCFCSNCVLDHYCESMTFR